MFVLSFARTNTGDSRDSFSDYYEPHVEKNKEEAYKKIIDMSNNNDCTTDNLLDFVYLRETTD